MIEATLEGRLTAVAERTCNMIEQCENNLELLYGIAKPIRAQRSAMQELPPQPPRFLKAYSRRFNGEKSFVTA